MEAQQALAFVAKRAATRRMSASRWGHIMSLELGWMSPGEAKSYIAACQEAGLLAVDGEDLAVTFDTAIDIPRGLRPDPGRPPAPRDEAADLFSVWLQTLTAGQDAAVVMERVEALQEEHPGLHAEAAILLVARAAGKDVRAAASQALETI